MSRELPFDPYPFLSSPHSQTILGAFLNFTPEPQSTQRLIQLPDGDKISLEVTTPKGWKASDPTVFLVHGLCGSHASPVLIRMASRLEALGIRAVRFNMRGCGSGKGHARSFTHGGRSEDLFECLKVMIKETPDSKITLVGYSLGANLVLKLAGELGRLASSFFSAVIAVSPPVELNTASLGLSKPENKKYQDYFYKCLRSEVIDLYESRKEILRIKLPLDLSLYEFDALYAAPEYGFSSVDEYYHNCSSVHYVTDIVLPCKILFAEDDPIIPHHMLDEHKLHSNVHIYKTKYGGHIGFLGSSHEYPGLFWLDSVVTDWILKF